MSLSEPYQFGKFIWILEREISGNCLKAKYDDDEDDFHQTWNQISDDDGKEDETNGREEEKEERESID